MKPNVCVERHSKQGNDSGDSELNYRILSQGRQMSYNFIDQQIVSSCLIQAYTDDSFYFPSSGNQHTGYAFDGSFYSLGVLQSAHPKASWFTEFGSNPFRGSTAQFPSFGVILLSPVSLVILDQSKAVAAAASLPLWMQFILGDNNALANNFDGSVQGFLPSKVIYADGIVSVTYSPDAGNQQYLHPTLVAPVTATAVAANVLTVTASNTFAVGQNVTFSGTAEAFLNGQTVTVASVIGAGPTFTGFTASFTHGNYTNNSDTGSASATLPLLPPYITPYPNVPVQSSMVVSVDFTKDSVYLDVAV